MADPEVGTRRPREGRCERCDRPLTDEVFELSTPVWPAGATPVVAWWEQDSTDTHCAGDPFCDAPEVDWKARALAAEARVAALEAVLTLGSAEAIRTACWDRCVSGKCDCEARASRIEDAITGGTQALDHAIERAEASARQHGLLVGAWCVDALAACVCGDHWTARNRHAPDCAAWMVDEVAALATAAKETP